MDIESIKLSWLKKDSPYRGTDMTQDAATAI